MVISKLSMSISKMWVEDWTSFDNLMDIDDIYGDFKVLIDDKILVGTEDVAEGKCSIRLILREFMLLRKYKNPPIKTAREFVELSGYEYLFEYPDVEGRDILRISVTLDGVPVSGFECLEFELSQVQKELRRFRQQCIELLLTYCEEKRAARWWESAVYEDMDDSKNVQGKY